MTNQTTSDQTTNSQTANSQTARDIDLINQLSRATLTENDVYIFKVRLCDNEVDRDFERFTEETLSELAELFIGVTGIFDHQWSASGQVARVFKTEIVTEGQQNSIGEPYLSLVAHLYVLGTTENESLIAEIEGGIKREASIGCSVRERRCSICGDLIDDCLHTPGGVYENTLCYVNLIGALDAYEWSFVAVPAQRNAGVIKRYSGKQKTDSDYDKLLCSLRDETLRLALLCGREMHKTLQSSVPLLKSRALLDLKSSLEKQLEDRFPLPVQIRTLGETVVFDGSDYLV